MAYETDLLDPVWWVNSLVGNTTVLLLLIQIWLLSYVRKIPNIKTFAVIIIGINISVIGYGIFAGEGLTIGSAFLTLLMVIFGYIAFSGFNDG